MILTFANPKDESPGRNAVKRSKNWIDRSSYRRRAKEGAKACRAG
jgi:hypothetical protein